MGFFVERGNFIVRQIFKPLAGREVDLFAYFELEEVPSICPCPSPSLSLSLLFFRSLVAKTQPQACLYIVSNYLLSFILSVPLPGPLKMK